MNILEAEDMVKGLPDQVLFQYAQNPPPQIPQYLAISEVQRRQDMRQRFQAQQGGNEPTVKDQILQGGIGATGMAPPISSAPPMAPMGAAPPGAPMQQPMTGAPMPPMGMAMGGLTPGGIVRMQQGRTVPGMTYPGVMSGQGDPIRQLELIRQQALISGDTETAKAATDQLKALIDERTTGPLGSFGAINSLLNLKNKGTTGLGFRDTATSLMNPETSPAPVSQQRPSAPSERKIQEILKKAAPARTPEENEMLRAAGYTLTRRTQDPEGLTSRVNAALAFPFIRSRTTDGAYLLSDEEIANDPRTGPLNERIYRALGGTQYIPPTATRPPMEAAVAQSAAPTVQQEIPTNFDFLAASRALTQNQNAPLIMPPANRQAVPDVPAGGIADVGAAMGATPPGATPRPSGMSFQSLLSGALKRERSPEMQQYMDMQRQLMEQGVPKPVDLSSFIQSAQQRQQEARDEARRMAIAGTLMNLGAGVMSGDPAAGLRQATQTAMGTLAEGRREAALEGRIAEQLQLQAAQQERQSAIDEMRLKSETLGSIANIVSGEERASRSDQLAAAQIMATYETALAREIRENERQGRTDANSMRAARTSALQQASQYLRSYLERTGEEISDEEFARRIRDMAKTFDPESFSSGEVSWDSLGGGR